MGDESGQTGLRRIKRAIKNKDLAVSRGRWERRGERVEKREEKEGEEGREIERVAREREKEERESW